MYRHREEARTRLYDPETFPIPMIFFDDMKQTKIDIGSVSKQRKTGQKKVPGNPAAGNCEHVRLFVVRNPGRQIQTEKKPTLYVWITSR